MTIDPADAAPARRCTSCKRDVPSEGFHKSTAWCRECVRSQIGRRLALDYDLELERQGGVCLICQQPPGQRRLALDHDHETGYFRGLLCARCNTVIGHVNDDPELLRRAAEYVERPGRVLVPVFQRRHKRRYPSHDQPHLQ